MYWGETLGDARKAIPLQNNLGQESRKCDQNLLQGKSLRNESLGKWEAGALLSETGPAGTNWEQPLSVCLAPMV